MCYVAVCVVRHWLYLYFPIVCVGVHLGVCFVFVLVYLVLLAPVFVTICLMFCAVYAFVYVFVIYVLFFIVGYQYVCADYASVLQYVLPCRESPRRCVAWWTMWLSCLCGPVSIIMCRPCLFFV